MALLKDNNGIKDNNIPHSSETNLNLGQDIFFEWQHFQLMEDVVVVHLDADCICHILRRW